MSMQMRVLWLISACLAVLPGCGEQISAYRLVSHEPAKAKKLLVLPFLDTRTFKDPRDPHMDTAREKAREIFVAAMRKMPAFQDKEIIVPPAERECDSISSGRIIELGKQHGADVVISGQIFSFTETRAASIPPRAGLFIRIFSVPDEQLVFVGDDYRAAAGPGARGGRELQVELAAQAILAEYVSVNPPVRQSRRTIKSEISATPDDAIKMLLLPFHDRPNPDNLIEHTGGGEVVTGIFEMELAKLGGIRLIYLPAEAGSHDRLFSVAEALDAAKKLGAAYVMRGQVIEFRRAMSVPSWYSAIISIAILAAQVMFAEVSGVDIATEVWRVADGQCVFARRDTEIQKYVVQAEKTVRMIAATTAPLIKKALTDDTMPAASPIIDNIVLKPRVQQRPAAREDATDEEGGPPQPAAAPHAQEAKPKPDEKEEAPQPPPEKKPEVQPQPNGEAQDAGKSETDKAAEKKESPAGDAETSKAETPAAPAPEKSAHGETSGGDAKGAPPEGAGER